MNLRYKLTLRSCHMQHILCNTKKEVYLLNHWNNPPARLNRYRRTRFRTRVRIDVLLARPSTVAKLSGPWIMIHESKNKNCIFSLFVYVLSVRLWSFTSFYVHEQVQLNNQFHSWRNVRELLQCILPISLFQYFLPILWVFYPKEIYLTGHLRGIQKRLDVSSSEKVQN